MYNALLFLTVLIRESEANLSILHLFDKLDLSVATAINETAQILTQPRIF